MSRIISPLFWFHLPIRTTQRTHFSELQYKQERDHVVCIPVLCQYDNKLCFDICETLLKIIHFVFLLKRIGHFELAKNPWVNFSHCTQLKLYWVCEKSNFQLKYCIRYNFIPVALINKLPNMIRMWLVFH